MDLNAYYKRKRRRTAVFKLAGFLLILSLAALIVWGLSDVLNTINVKQIFTKNEAQIKTPPWLIFCSDKNECFYVNADGVLEEKAPNFSENPLPELISPALRRRLQRGEQGDFSNGDRILSQPNVTFLKVFVIEIQNIKGAIKKIEIVDLPANLQAGNQEVKFFFQEGWFLLASFELPAEQIAQDLKLLLDQKIGQDRPRLEYVDLRFPDKAFYKLR